MKVTVDFDCTPEEARRLMGLPDLTPIHQAYIERMQKAVTEGLTPEIFLDMARSWGPMSEAGMNMWKAMVDGMSGGAIRSSGATGSGGGRSSAK